MTPDMRDASLTRCRTPEGIVLKEVRRGRGMGIETLLAVRLQRYPLDLTAVLPPSELLMPQSWGLPQ
jgi:hypothetical protein